MWVSRFVPAAPMMYVKPMNCPSCAFVNPTCAKFCLKCGTRLEAAPLPEGERRVVTVFFADVAGSTAIGDKNSMKAYLAPALRTLERLRSAQGRDGDTAAAGEEALRLSVELAEAVANLDLQVGAAVPA